MNPIHQALKLTQRAGLRDEYWAIHLSDTLALRAAANNAASERRDAEKMRAKIRRPNRRAIHGYYCLPGEPLREVA